VASRKLWQDLVVSNKCDTAPPDKCKRVVVVIPLFFQIILQSGYNVRTPCPCNGLVYFFTELRLQYYGYKISYWLP